MEKLVPYIVGAGIGMLVTLLYVIRSLMARFPEEDRRLFWQSFWTGLFRFWRTPKLHIPPFEYTADDVVNEWNDGYKKGYEAGEAASKPNTKNS